MENDKLTVTMDTEASGTLLKIIHPVGDVAAIAKSIAVIGEPGEDLSALADGDDAVTAEAPTAFETTAPVAVP